MMGEGCRVRVRIRNLMQVAAVLSAMSLSVVVVFAQTTPPTGNKPALIEPPEKGTEVSTGGAPHIELSTTVWDFGEKWSGEPAETVITIMNTGTAVLTIDQIKSSCGCTAAQAKKKELAPGESEDIRVSYTTKKNAEKVSQKVRILTNDPQTPETVLEVKGRVKQLIKLSEGSDLNLGNVGLNETVTRSVEFECAYPEPLNLTLEPNAAPFFDLALETLEPGKRFKLTATTKPPLTEGQFNTNAVMKTGLETIPDLSLRVWGLAQGPIAISPKILYVTSQRNEPSRKTLRVTCRGEKPISITSIKADLESIQAEILNQTSENALPGQNPDTTLIQVTLPPASEFPDAEVAIRITTDSAEVGELIVPVRKAAGRAPLTTEKSPTAPTAPTARKRPSVATTPEKNP